MDFIKTLIKERFDIIVRIVCVLLSGLSIYFFIETAKLNITKKEIKQEVGNIGKAADNAAGKIDTATSNSSKKSEDIKNNSNKVKEKTKTISDNINHEQITIKLIKINLEKSIVSHGFKIGVD